MEKLDFKKWGKFKIYGDYARFNYCPVCKREKSNPDFSVNLNTGQYYCFSTGKSGNIKEFEDFNIEHIKIFKPAKEQDIKEFKEVIYNTKPLNNEWLNYLKTRCISATNEGIKRNMRVNQYNSLTIPITNGNKIIGVKYRTIDKKISSEKGSQSNYFINWQNIKDNDYLIIVEGEIDLLSSIEVGFDNVVSLPFGAMNLKCIDNQMEWLINFKKIIIAVDNDEQGEKSKQGIIKKLLNIKNKVYSVNLGEYKDFNEVLTSRGAETLKNIISRAEKIKDDNIALSPSFFDEDKRFLFDVFARYFKEKFNVIKIDSELHCYSDGIYTKNNNLEKKIIDIIPNLKDSYRQEVLKYLNLICEDKEKNDDGLIAFNNGIYNIVTDELLEFNSKYIITNKIPWNYNKNIYSKIMDNTLNEFAFNDENTRKLIDEVIGYTFFNKNELGKAFIITGEKANGKSTFLKILMYLLGKNNCSALNLDDIVNSRFRLYQVAGKLLNIGDDIGSGYIPEAENLKKLITGDIITTEQKGKAPIEFNCYAKFLFSANDIPRIKDPTGAMARRLIIIPFKNKFDINKKDYDPYFLDKIKNRECMEYLIFIGIQGLKRVLANKKFSETKETTQMLNDFNKNNNPILEYIEFLKEDNEIEILFDELINNFSCMKILNGVYEFQNNIKLIGFNEWANDNGYQKQSIRNFKKNMCSLFHLEEKRIKKNGTFERYFIKKLPVFK